MVFVFVLDKQAVSGSISAILCHCFIIWCEENSWNIPVSFTVSDLVICFVFCDDFRAVSGKKIGEFFQNVVVNQEVIKMRSMGHIKREMWAFFTVF